MRNPIREHGPLRYVQDRRVELAAELDRLSDPEQIK